MTALRAVMYNYQRTEIILFIALCYNTAMAADFAHSTIVHNGISGEDDPNEKKCVSYIDAYHELPNAMQMVLVGWMNRVFT